MAKESRATARDDGRNAFHSLVFDVTIFFFTKLDRPLDIKYAPLTTHVEGLETIQVML